MPDYERGDGRPTLGTVDRDVQVLANNIKMMDNRIARIESKIEAGYATKEDLKFYISRPEFRPVAAFVYFVIASMGAAILGALWTLVGIADGHR